MVAQIPPWRFSKSVEKQYPVAYRRYPMAIGATKVITYKLYRVYLLNIFSTRFLYVGRSID